MFNKNKRFFNIKKDGFLYQKKYDNPYQPPKKVGFKKKIEVCVLILSVFGIIYLLIYNNFFHITDIKVSGLQRVKAADMDDTILGILEDKKLLIFPGASYFFIDVDEVKNILKEKYPIERISVQKSFPSTLSVDLQEKISTVIYDNSKKYSYLDLQGIAVETASNVFDNEWSEKIKITTSTLADGTIRTDKEVVERSHIPDIKRITAEMGNYPILYDLSQKDIELNKHVLKPEIVSGAIEWFNFLNKKNDITFSYIKLENDIGEGSVVTKEGFEIKTNLSERLQQQFDQLDFLLKEKISNTHNLNYIDLRYSDRVFWK